MNNVVKIKFSDYELNNETKYMSEQEAKDLLAKRDAQILTPAKLKEKLMAKSKEVQCLNPESKNNKVFVYFSKGGEETDTPVHFYDNEGNLIMTFPFDGEIAQEGKHYRAKYVDRNLSKYSHGPIILPSIKEFRFTATESGRIFINSMRKEPGGRMNDTTSLQYSYDGKPFFIFVGGFSPDEYPNKEVANAVKDYLKKNRSDGTLFAYAAVGGDKFVDYAKKHSRMA